MIRYIILFLTATTIACAPASVSQPVATAKLAGRDLIPLGRFAVAGDNLELISSAAHFGFSFQGKECTILFSTAASQFGYIQYELDGIYQKRLRVEGERSLVKIVAEQGGEHKVRIFKTTEAHTGPIYVLGIEGTALKPLAIPSRPLIEFIGNSITCGAASDPSEITCGTGSYHDQHNAYMSYGPRIARALDVNFSLSSVSGIGIYRNWNSDGPTMPDVYENTDFRERGRRWDFSTVSPAVVSIALGTNDFSNGDGKKPRLPFDSATYTKKYLSFVKTVKSKYPSAQIVLLNSPMVSGTRNDIFVDCLNRVQRKINAAFPADKPVAVFLFKPMKARGCGGHPSVEDHGMMAQELLEFFRPLVKP